MINGGSETGLEMDENGVSEAADVAVDGSHVSWHSSVDDAAPVDSNIDGAAPVAPNIEDAASPL